MLPCGFSSEMAGCVAMTFSWSNYSIFFGLRLCVKFVVGRILLCLLLIAELTACYLCVSRFMSMGRLWSLSQCLLTVYNFVGPDCVRAMLGKSLGSQPFDWGEFWTQELLLATQSFGGNLGLSLWPLLYFYWRKNIKIWLFPISLFVFSPLFVKNKKILPACWD